MRDKFSLQQLADELDRRGRNGGNCNCPDCWSELNGVVQQLRQKIHDERIAVAKQNCYEPSRKLPAEPPVEEQRAVDPGVVVPASAPRCSKCGQPATHVWMYLVPLCQQCYMTAFLGGR